MTPAPDPAAAGLAPDPAAGRVYATERSVRTTDVTPSGRLRLDALARYLQEAAEDDVADSGWDEPAGWLLRRCEIVLRGYPAWGEAVRLRTFCSGLGPRWAERTTTLSRGREDLIQARAVWVATDPRTGAPARLSEAFLRVYGPSARAGRVPARLVHPGPGPGARSRPWPLRAADFDPAGHVNNTVHWAAAEDELAQLSWLPVRAEMEYPRQILPGARPRLVSADCPGGRRLWLADADGTLGSAVLARPARA